MATTGAPWNIPYVEPTDIPRTYPEDSEDLAEAIAAGLSAAGGLVAVKSAIFQGVQTASVTAASNVAVTDLTITHALADASNKLIISAFFGVAGTSHGFGTVGIAVHDGSGLIAIGNAEGSRTRVTAGGNVSANAATFVVTMPSVTFVHTPNTTDSKTYTVRAINIRTTTSTLFINRAEADGDALSAFRAVSSLVIQEVKV